ncbi:phosphoribosyl-ATP pyrophosphohydrolase [Halobacillus fulvus]|nr:phosphoribosyl-ATP pyrophosphohydrolase [Halobacillus fulvus]
MPKYNKLVRDRIPEIIEANGKSFQSRTLEEQEYIHSLRAKLQEEMTEYLATENNHESLTELADLLEVVHALAHTHNGTMEELELIRQHKKKERGAFQNRVFLMDVDE